MKAIVILVILISATAHGAIFDSIESVDVLRQKSVEATNANRTPSSEKPVEATPEDQANDSQPEAKPHDSEKAKN